MYRGQNYRSNYRNKIYERGRSRSRERQYAENTKRNDRSSSNGSRSGSRASTNRDMIRCYKCREYDHFAKDCPTSKLEKEAQAIQQMYNMDEEQISVKTIVTDTYDSLNQVHSINEIANRSFKITEGKNSPTTFLPLHTKVGGQARHIKDKETICLMNDQARDIYKKVRIIKCYKCGYN